MIRYLRKYVKQWLSDIIIGMTIQKLSHQFIVKRAFRRGLTSRADVIKVLGISSATASRHMSAVAVLYADIVWRKGGGIRPRPLGLPPGFASEASLLDDLDTGRNDPLRTGLFEDELPVVYVSWTKSMPAKPGVLTRIVHAIQHDRLLKIIYISLRLGDLPSERRILPLALERMNDQWRVVAQDIEKDGAPIRVFVLSRILDAEPDIGRKRKNFVHQGPTDSMTDVPVMLNPRLTKHQQQAIARELRVENGKISVATRSLHEFGRRFADEALGQDAVWPPLILNRSR